MPEGNEEEETQDESSAPSKEELIKTKLETKDMDPYDKIRKNYEAYSSEDEDEEDEKDNFKVLATQNQTESTQQKEVKILFHLEALDSNEIERGKPLWVSDPPVLEADCNMPVMTIELQDQVFETTPELYPPYRQ